MPFTTARPEMTFISASSYSMFCDSSAAGCGLLSANANCSVMTKVFSVTAITGVAEHRSCFAYTRHGVSPALAETHSSSREYAHSSPHISKVTATLRGFRTRVSAALTLRATCVSFSSSTASLSYSMLNSRASCTDCTVPPSVIYSSHARASPVTVMPRAEMSLPFSSSIV